MSRTIVPMFLSEMDGLEDSNAMVLLSTNRPKDLDPAIVRDGRIDRKVYVGRPSHESTKQIFNINLKGVPMIEEDLSDYATDSLFSEKKVLFTIVLNEGEVQNLALRHLINGAMVAGVVERAKEMAMTRDIKEGGVCRGVSREDVDAAIGNTMTELAGLDHKHAIEDLIGDVKRIKSIHKAV